MMVGLGLFVAASFVLPNLPVVLQPIFKMRGNKGFQRLLKQLKNKNVIILGGEKIKLTKKGRHLLKEIQLQRIEIPRPEEWDGMWYLVAYDVPDTQKKERDWFRQTLERMEFYQIQESLWVHPFECRQEIAVISQNLGISPHVIVMNTDKLPNQIEMEERFNLNE